MALDLEAMGQLSLLEIGQWRSIISVEPDHRLVVLCKAIPWMELMEKATPILYDEQGIASDTGGRKLNLRAHLGAYILQTHIMCKSTGPPKTSQPSSSGRGSNCTHETQRPWEKQNENGFRGFDLRLSIRSSLQFRASYARFELSNGGLGIINGITKKEFKSLHTTILAISPRSFGLMPSG